MRKHCVRCAKAFETSDITDTRCKPCYMIGGCSVLIGIGLLCFIVAFSLCGAAFLAWKLIL